MARDEDGNYLGASVQVAAGQSDLEVMEVVACREGLALASDLGLHSFRVASEEFTGRGVRHVRTNCSGDKC